MTSSICGTACSPNHLPYAVKVSSGSGTPCSAARSWAAPYAAGVWLPSGSESGEAQGSEVRNMPSGMWSRHVAIGRPRTRSRSPAAAACAAIESP